MTLPQVQALNDFWRTCPPAAMQLRRISLFLGIKPDAIERHVAATPDEAMQEAQAAGLPVMHGRPDDPLLAFLDL